MADEKPLDSALVWFRRDLRADDHAALYHALRAARQVWCAFVYDRAILDELPRADRRVEFIAESVAALAADLAALGERHGVPGVRLLVRHGQGADEIVALAAELHVQAVYANHDDDPYALARDARVRGALADLGVALHTSKDHVIFERSEVLTGSGKPYSVFTPYKAAWLAKLDDYFLTPYPVERHAASLAPTPAGVAGALPTLARLGFVRTNLDALKVHGGSAAAQALFTDFLQRIDDYADAREYPAVKGPSYLGVHLRFGTISIRRVAAAARAHAADAGRHARGAETWLSELIWRDFFQQVLHHLPHVVGAPCRPEFDKVRFEHGRHADAAFSAWCEGRTGYPLVDAAMAQINQTGWMHNRLRMLAASFLTKDLGIDWRRGEAYFAHHLIDYELASNNGGWQWAASTGCDAQPWFRIFNPLTQSRRFDPEGKFIRRYLPQLGRLDDAQIHAPWLVGPIELEAAGVELGRNYPRPIVDHAEARVRTLQRYGVVRAANVA
ncbi:MAG TPA: deoxyribodipyrimidine photo-lyase [Caldimonas sp.]|jgi:deoxyribodipyrimidine photo-lyase|nr:deoxyribodipyrimidine photo-lyase [Caldimonas sp.]HEX4233561.1 deoxyribodipyrimidine photo-lyase [Caldimonas sp.]